jgi:hypothetical protein
MFLGDPTDDVIVDDTDGSVTTDDGQADESGDRSAPGTQDVGDEADERGVSYKNRFFEAERKLENLSKSIPQMIQEAATAAAQQTGTQVRKSSEPEYGINDYISAKVRDPQNAAFYDTKIEELREKKVAEVVRNEMNLSTRQMQEQQLRAQADTWAFTNFPQLNDPNNAFTQEVNRQYHSRPEGKREPQDYAIAAELVAARLGIKPVNQVNPQQDKVKQLEKKNKSLLKERTLEGDGRGAITPNVNSQKQKDYQAAVDKGDFTGYIAKYHLKPVESE